jgi:hypothetical protein
MRKYKLGIISEVLKRVRKTGDFFICSSPNKEPLARARGSLDVIFIHRI